MSAETLIRELENEASIYRRNAERCTGESTKSYFEGKADMAETVIKQLKGV